MRELEHVRLAEKADQHADTSRGYVVHHQYELVGVATLREGSSRRPCHRKITVVGCLSMPYQREYIGSCLAVDKAVCEMGEHTSSYS